MCNFFFIFTLLIGLIIQSTLCQIQTSNNQHSDTSYTQDKINEQSLSLDQQLKNYYQNLLDNEGSLVRFRQNVSMEFPQIDPILLNDLNQQLQVNVSSEIKANSSNQTTSSNLDKGNNQQQFPQKNFQSDLSNQMNINSNIQNQKNLNLKDNSQYLKFQQVQQPSLFDNLYENKEINNINQAIEQQDSSMQIKDLKNSNLNTQSVGRLHQNPMGELERFSQVKSLDQGMKKTTSFYDDIDKEIAFKQGNQISEREFFTKQKNFDSKIIKSNEQEKRDQQLVSRKSHQNMIKEQNLSESIFSTINQEINQGDQNNRQDVKNVNTNGQDLEKRKFLQKKQEDKNKQQRIILNKQIQKNLEIIPHFVQFDP